ncbi:MAG: cation:proton antiporter [Candidatus Zixiibacteriota bacterium]
MTEHMLLGLGSILVLGIAAQWLAWRVRLPAILLLLVFGFIAGPISGILEPDELFGPLLFPLVSISVAIILFEGGLSLRIKDLKQVGSVFISLITIGLLITWFLITFAAYFIVGLEFPLALLLGAMLVVSGPTVIIPLLRQVRPSGSVGSIVKWEGIVNDPLGAILAVLVFEIIITGNMQTSSLIIILGVLKGLVSGLVIGAAGAGIMILLLKRFLIPDYLQNPVSLMLVIVCYFVTNLFQMEAGLLTVTVMGVALANQKIVSIKHILEFKENLRVLLISSLFIILAARVSFEEMGLGEVSSWFFVGVLIVIIRPAAVVASTLGSKLKFNERAFLAWMAPRGIVAAAVISVFSIRLVEVGFAEASQLVPLTFLVIVGTVTVYGLTAPPVAQWLKVAQPNPQGVLFVGANAWVLEIARRIRDEGFPVVVVDSNWANVTQARQSGCQAYYGNILSDELTYELQLDGIGRLLALTPNDEVNSLAALHFVDLFGSSEVYQLPPVGTDDEKKKKALPSYLCGRFLFDKTANFESLENRFRSSAVVKKNLITEEFDYDRFQSRHNGNAIPLFIITESRKLHIYTTDDHPVPRIGQTLVSIVPGE